MSNTSYHTGSWLALGVIALSLGVEDPAFAQMKTSKGSHADHCAMDELSVPASRPGDIRSAGAFFIAPRYLPHVGDAEIYLDPVYVLSSTPQAPGSPWIGQVGLEYKLSDALELHASVSPYSLIGFRGPLFEADSKALGWAAYYRTDSYPTGGAALPPGVGAPLFGLLPLGGVGEARGAELRFNGMHRHSMVNVFISPVASVMSNRTNVGADLGLDLDLGQVVLGYTGSFKYNVLNPYSGISNFQNVELQHVVGGRVILDDHLYLQANYFMVPADTYGNSVNSIVAGIGYRFGQGAASPVASSGGMHTSH